MEQPPRKISDVHSDHFSNDAAHHDVLVLKSKIYKPAIRKEFVNRQALIDRLEEKISYPLTLISASTGCGKSVTASQWLEEKGHKYGWLSLDEEHNDPHVFITYLVALLKDQWPQKAFGLESLQQGVNLPSNLVAKTFIDDMDQLEDLFVLVLDDYQMIREEIIHEIINGILRHPPELFHLVILTQRDPPLHLARLRAWFRVNEIRMSDLAFTIEEASELRSLIAADTTDDQLNTVVDQTEGWITGITAGLMGLSKGLNLEKVVKALHSGVSVISDLLEEVVIGGLPRSVQKFLELTSMLDRFSEELVREMLASVKDPDLSEMDTRTLIRQSRAKNLFLIPLDSAGEWYRYHHLFRGQIRQRSGKYFNEETTESLYKAASEWFEEKLLLEEALTYALQAGDMAYAIRLYSRFRNKLLNREQLQRLDRLTNQFPESARNNHVEILLISAILQVQKANFGDMRQYLSKAEKMLNGRIGRDDHERQLLGEYHSVSTYLSYMVGDFDKAIGHGDRSMELLPSDDHNFFREFAAGWYSFAQQASGRVSAGLDRLDREYRILAKVDPYFQMRLLQGKCIVHLFEVHTEDLYNDASSLANICSPKKYLASWLIGIYGMTYQSYLKNDLEATNQFHDDLRLHRYGGRPIWIMHHFFVECLSAMARGLWQRVEQCMADCEELATELGIEPLKGMVKAFQVEYYLRRNDADRAREVSAFANFEPFPPLFYYYIPQLTRAKLFFHTDQDEKGQELLQSLVDMGRARHNKNLLIQALALQAVIHYGHDRTELAKSMLNEVLKIVDGKRVIRPFLDHGQTMHDLLRVVSEDQPENKKVTELLQAFDADRHLARTSDPISSTSKEKRAYDLTTREIEILYLVSQGFKNKEIAEKSFISLTTVKQHLYRTYQKLEVNNRASAIKRAKDLGLFANDQGL